MVRTLGLRAVGFRALGLGFSGSVVWVLWLRAFGFRV